MTKGGASLMLALLLAAVTQTLIPLVTAQPQTNRDPRRAAPPADTKVADRRYDLVVVGGTAGGVACAVRAAREGLGVLLVNHSPHLGGMVSGGIGVMDTLYEGSRAPVLDEFNRRVLDYYRAKYGADSPQYKITLPAPLTEATKRLTFESHVAEKVIDDLVKNEKSLTVLKGYYPVGVERAERDIQAVILSTNPENPESQKLRITGRIFVDATYEADLAALAGVPYRVGRESRDEYDEPHAGRIFTKRLIVPGRAGSFPYAAKIGELKLRPFQAVNQEIFAGSTGEGDTKVQAYHYRLCLTNNPNNRRAIEKPENYDREQIVKLFDPYRGLTGTSTNIANNKIAWFQNLSGGSSEYPTAGWAKRREIMKRHRDFALGAVYYLQNDSSISEEARAKAREWGLPKDEFVDNDNFPYEMYIREARRIVGRYVFTEHDASLAPGLRRAPVHEDGIAIAEWFMDSHEVSTERQPGSDFDGKILLTEKTRPSQIPFRTLLAQGLDNLMVPVCVSSTHVAWGTIRLEPTWMHIGEAAGFAAALALKTNTSPGQLSPAQLQRRLAENGVMLSFFNDFDMQTKAPWVAAVQYLSTKGFFDSYNARADEPLTRGVAHEWARTFGELASGKSNATERARALSRALSHKDESNGQAAVTTAQFAAMLSHALAYWNVKEPMEASRGVVPLGLNANARLTRGDACRVVYQMLAQVKDNN